MAKKYRRKPCPIEAIQYTGDNAAEVIAWAPDSIAIDPDDRGLLRVETCHTLRCVGPGDWIFRGEDGWFDVDSGSWLLETYEPIGGDQ